MAVQRSYSLKLQTGGRVVVPQAVRAELGVQEGDELLLVKTGRGFQLTTRKALLDAAIGSLARDDGRAMTQELLDERRAKARAYRESSAEMQADPLFDLDSGHGLEREDWL